MEALSNLNSRLANVENEIGTLQALKAECKPMLAFFKESGGSVPQLESIARDFNKKYKVATLIGRSRRAFCKKSSRSATTYRC